MPVVAIDGPAGSGKSTAAKLAAKKLGYRYLDTGAMYRTATLISMQSGISPAEEDKLVREVKAHEMFFEDHNGLSRVILDGKDVSEDIRLPELTRLIGPVCEVPGIRRIMGGIQRKMGEQGGVVLEGRDISTVIFPDAEVKIYLDAAPEVRTRRRMKELNGKGVQADFDDVLKDIIARDERDMNREAAPLKKAEDAVEIDTSEMTVDEVVDIVIGLVNKYVSEYCV